MRSQFFDTLANDPNSLDIILRHAGRVARSIAQRNEALASHIGSYILEHATTFMPREDDVKDPVAMLIAQMRGWGWDALKKERGEIKWLGGPGWGRREQVDTSLDYDSLRFESNSREHQKTVRLKKRWAGATSTGTDLDLIEDGRGGSSMRTADNSDDMAEVLRQILRSRGDTCYRRLLRLWELVQDQDRELSDAIDDVAAEFQINRRTVLRDVIHAEAAADDICP